MKDIPYEMYSWNLSNKQKAKIISTYWDDVPGKQFEEGRTVIRYDRYYIYVEDTTYDPTIEQWPIDIFYRTYVTGEDVSHHDMCQVDYDINYKPPIVYRKKEKKLANFFLRLAHSLLRKNKQ